MLTNQELNFVNLESWAIGAARERACGYHLVIMGCLSVITLGGPVGEAGSGTQSFRSQPHKLHLCDLGNTCKMRVRLLVILWGGCED